MSVVLLHSSVVARHPVWHIPFFSDFGWLGVQLFFVISGFIIADTVDRSKTATQFLLRRYLRVLPLYGAVTLAALAISLAVGSDIFTNGRTDSAVPQTVVSDFYLLKSLLVVPQDPWPFFMVGWSLEFEVVFYTLFGLAYFLGGRAAAIGAVALASLIGAAAPEATAVFLGPNFIYFLAGCLCREIYRSGAASNRAGLSVVFMASVIPALLQQYEIMALPWPVSRLPWILALGALVLLFLNEEASLRNFRCTRQLVLLGNISFSLYLVHWLVFPIARLSAKGLVAEGWSAEVWRWGAIALSLYLAWGAWKFVEEPMNAQVRKRLANAVKRPHPAAARI